MGLRFVLEIGSSLYLGAGQFGGSFFCGVFRMYKFRVMAVVKDVERALREGETGGFSYVCLNLDVGGSLRVKFGIEATWFVVLWGDGADDSRRAHRYERVGVYEVMIVGRNFRVLDFGWCGVTDVDVSRCEKLRELRCTGNELDVLEVSRCVELRVLDCSKNHIRELCVRGFSELVLLNCSGNELSELDLSGCGMLQEVDLGRNRIEVLKVCGCEELRVVLCSSNRIVFPVFQSIFEGLRVMPEGRTGVFWAFENPGYRKNLSYLFCDKGWFFARR